MVNHLLETRHPLLPPLYVSVSPCVTRLPFSVHTSKFRILQILCLPLLRKYPGVWGHSSHFGSLLCASLRLCVVLIPATFRLKLPSTCGAKIPTRSGRAFLPPATLFHPWLANDSANTSLPTCTGAKRSRAPFASPRIPPSSSHGKTGIAGSKLAQDTVK